MTPLMPAVIHSLRQWLAGPEAVGSDGAYVAWYDADVGEMAFTYPEITGYALTHLAALPDPTDAERARSIRAVEWLSARWRDGDHSARSGWDDDRTYFFDLAMQANGLLLSGVRLDLPDALDVAGDIVSALAEQVRRHGALPAIPPNGPSPRTGWSTQGVAHLAKGVQCLLHARVTIPDRVGTLDDVIPAVVAQALDVQRPDGRFVTDPADEVTMLHPHLYAVDGLWCHAQATGDQASARAAQAGAAWVWQHQLPSGGLPRHVPPAGPGVPGPEQLDLTAQAVRAAYLTGTHLAAAERAAERLTDLAVPRAAGSAALPYQPGSGRLHLNTWVTLFAGQALGLASGGHPVSWQELV
jgi:hypothetical protein